jgi:hypothetical protein
LSYNPLHHFANTKDENKFIEFFGIVDYEIINQFDDAGDTCLDLAFSMFKEPSIKKILKILQARE